MGIVASVTLDEHRLAFGSAADRYDRSRPTYPIEALNWTFAPAGAQRLRVVDLGAGTGLLSRVVMDAGHEVIPVEPDAGMRAQLDAATPGVKALDGSAEAIPLPDASVDAVIAGTAYHWFDPKLTHPEVARVLRPGGIFAALWNDRDLSLAWMAAFNRLLQTLRITYEQRSVLDSTLSFGPLFGPADKLQFPHNVTRTPQGLSDLIATRSYFLVASPQRQTELLDAVAELCATHPDLAGRETFEMPYRTTVYRARKL